MPSPEERFWAKVDKTDDCWLWTANATPNGYGLFHLDGRQWMAHRVVYEWWIGPIPEGLEIDHLCRVRHCVNPDHLEAVTHSENQLRGDTIAARNAAKTHCVNGHEFTPENTLVDPRGSRRCRACGRETSRNYYNRTKQGAR